MKGNGIIMEEENDSLEKAWGIVSDDSKMAEVCRNILYEFMKNHKLISEKGNVESSDLRIVLDLTEKIWFDLCEVKEILHKEIDVNIPF